MTTYELTADQMEELKQNYLFRLYMEANEEPSYGELAAASEVISDETIHEYWNGVDFSDDDFWCMAFKED